MLEIDKNSRLTLLFSLIFFYLKKLTFIKSSKKINFKTQNLLFKIIQRFQLKKKSGPKSKQRPLTISRRFQFLVSLKSSQLKAIS
jgi:hypothetical protein